MMAPFSYCVPLLFTGPEFSSLLSVIIGGIYVTFRVYKLPV